MKNVALLALTMGLAVLAQAEEKEVAWGNGNGNGNKEANCSKLSTSEQQFADMLSSKNRRMFCEKFSSDQRRNAMSKSNDMQADAAVERVMKDNKMMYPQ